MTDDLSDKLSGILNDPAAMQEIAALASQLGMDAPGELKEGKKGTGERSEENGTRGTRPHDPPDHKDSVDLQGLMNSLNLNGHQQKTDSDTVSQLMALAPMLGKLRQEDETTRLLDAMRPFLSEERQHKLDKAKRLIKVLRLMPLVRELPLFDL